METAKRLLILLAVGLLSAGSAQSSEKPARRISNTRTASCLVKITCDPAILPADSRAIGFLLRSSAVGGRAAREILDLSAEEAVDLFTVEYLQLPFSESGTTRRGSPKGVSRMGAKEDEMDEYEYAMMMEEYGSMPISPDKPSRPRATRTPKAKPAISSDAQMYLFGLNVHLQEEFKPAAKEFMSALVENLRRALLDSYSATVDKWNSQLRFAQDQRDRVRLELTKAMGRVDAIGVTPPVRLNPADAAVHEQLEQLIDLSNLRAGMSFDEVIAELENSVDPPLQIQPNWKDLLEIADLEPTTPGLMDPLSGVKVRKALEMLLAGVSGDSAEVDYVVDEGVIVIATEEALPRKMVTHVYDVPALVHSAGSAGSLIPTIQKSIEPDSWLDLSDTGEGAISVYAGGKLAILQTNEVHLKIQDFLQSMMAAIPLGTPSQIDPELLQGEKLSLLREQRNIEMETARLEARRSAIGRQIMTMEMQIKDKLKADPVMAEMRQLIEMHASQLAVMEEKLTPKHPSFVDIKEKLARARIELAQRHEQLSKSAGGDRLIKYSDELADIEIELVEKTAATRVLNERLGQAEQQLMASTVFDPHVSKVRTAAKAFEIADERVNELNTRIASLRPPVVSILGAE